MKQDTMRNEVRVDFYFHADKLEFAVIDNLMGITATKTRTKDSFKIKEFAEDYWVLSSGYELSEDINVQLNKIFDAISSKTDVIKSICRQYDASCGFLVAVELGDYMPAMYYERDFVQFAAEINAEINVDYN